MIENIAFWGGIASIVVCIFAIIILFLTKQNISNLLNRDKILFDDNFVIKKEAIGKALSLTDSLMEKGDALKSNREFNLEAKESYNNLLCVLSDVKIADEFYDIAIDSNISATPVRIAQFKLMCRKDIGFKTNQAKTVKRLMNQRQPHAQQPLQRMQMPSAPAQSAAQEHVFKPTEETKPTEQASSQPRPAQPRPAQARPAPTSATQTRPVAPRPAQPRPATAPAQQAMAQKVATPGQAVKKPGRPKNDN